MSEVLTLDEIDVLLGEAKTRGEYKPVISRFFESGELYFNLSERFPGKDAQSLRNSVKINLVTNAALYGNPDYKLIIVGEKPENGGTDSRSVLLINMTVHAAQKAAEAANSEN